MEVYNSVRTGEFKILAASTTQLPDIPCRKVKFKAKSGNTGLVYIGANVLVEVPDGTTDIISGWELDTGATEWIPVHNLNLFWGVGDTINDVLIYIAIG